MVQDSTNPTSAHPEVDHVQTHPQMGRYDSLLDHFKRFADQKNYNKKRKGKEL